MDYKKKMEELQLEIELLNNEISKKVDECTDLFGARKLLVKKEGVLSQKKSELAITLIERVRTKIAEIDNAILANTEESKKIKEQLVQRQELLEQIQTNPALYIVTQISDMISVFWKYIEDNIDDIGMAVTTTYTIKPIVQGYNSRYRDCKVPTGEMGIFMDGVDEHITKSTNFPYEQERYTLHRDSYGYMICTYTEWFEGYVEKFINMMSDVLVENNNLRKFDDTFSITVSNGVITLELI